MADTYGIDLNEMGLDDFRKHIEHDDLLPSRQILREGASDHFTTFTEMGMRTLQDLIDAFKTKKRLEALSVETQINLDYLKILRREAMSYVPNPVYFRDIPGLDSDLVASLEEIGIKHTQHFFAQGKTHAERIELSSKTGRSLEDLQMVAGMTDLARVGFMGPVFVRLVYDAGVHDSRTLAESDPEILLDDLHRVNEAQDLTTPMPALKDLIYCIHNAGMLPQVFQDL